MGILHDAISYVKDEKTGKEGFLTKHEALYPLLPKAEKCEANNEKTRENNAKNSVI